VKIVWGENGDYLSLCKCGVLCVVSYVCSVCKFPLTKRGQKQHTCKYVDVYKKKNKDFRIKLKISSIITLKKVLLIIIEIN